MKVSSLRWGIILLGTGLTLLAINFGYLTHFVWGNLLSLWPVLLIAIGIELTFRRSKFALLGILSPLLILAAFAYVAVISWQGGSLCYSWSFSQDKWDSYSREVFNYEIDNDPDIKNLEINIDFGLGDLWIGSKSNKLFSGDFEYRYKKPHCSFESYEGTGRINISTKDSKRFNIFRHGKFKNDARIFITDNIPIDLDIDVGVAMIELDLSELIVEKLRLDMGAAKTELRLGCKSKSISIDINTGASKLLIEIPREMGLEIDSDAALSSTNFESAGLKKYHGKYRSKNFETADCIAEITIDSGISKIEIDYY